jgi:transposase
MKTIPLYAGLDVHSEFTVGTVYDERGNSVRELKVPTSPVGYKRLFFGLGNVTAVFEAGRNWTYIAQLLKPHCQFKMAHPLKVRAIASARIKTDEIDSRILAHLLRTDLIPESYMPPEKIVDLRNLVRYRVRLGRLSTYLKNRTHAILSREGHKSDFKPYERKAKLWIKNLKMNPIDRDELEHTLKLLEDLKIKIKELDEKLEKERIKYPEADLLTTIPGISTYSAFTHPC